VHGQDDAAEAEHETRQLPRRERLAQQRRCRYLTRSSRDAEDLVQDDSRGGGYSAWSRTFGSIGCGALREEPGDVPETAASGEPRTKRPAH
jgi:hypothetical protein